MIPMTYIMQVLTLCGAVAAAMLGLAAVSNGSVLLAAVNAALFVINVGLFLWQFQIRGALR